jgi:hypothetical protein
MTHHSRGPRRKSHGDDGESTCGKTVGAVEKVVRNYLFKGFEKLGISNRVRPVLCCV